MSLNSIIASGIKTAKNITDSLQGYITIEFWTGDDAYGESSFTSPVRFKALIDLSSRPTFNSNGQLMETKANLTILESIPATQAKPGEVRGQPLDPRDVIRLPDGTTGPIIKIGGFVNADTNLPFLSEVTIGR